MKWRIIWEIISKLSSKEMMAKIKRDRLFSKRITPATLKDKKNSAQAQ